MRRTLTAVCLSLGLTACGGTEDTTEAQDRQVEQAAKPPPLLPYCWDIDKTSCSPVGATQNCQDGIWSDYVCTCRSYTWDCDEVR